MPRRIRVLQRIIEHIGVSIKALGVGWPHRATELLLLLVAQGKPRAELILLVELADKAGLREADGERLEGDAVEAARGTPWHDAVRADEPTQRRVVVACIVVQQAGAVQALAGVVALGLGDAS